MFLEVNRTFSPFLCYVAFRDTGVAFPDKSPAGEENVPRGSLSTKTGSAEQRRQKNPHVSENEAAPAQAGAVLRIV